MTHVKRIRQSTIDSEKLDIIVTSKGHWETKQWDEAKLREVLQIKEGEVIQSGEVKVPHQMIYVKETFDKFKSIGWPLTFNTQPSGFNFV